MVNYIKETIYKKKSKKFDNCFCLAMQLKAFSCCFK